MLNLCFLKGYTNLCIYMLAEVVHVKLTIKKIDSSVLLFLYRQLTRNVQK